MRVRRNIDGPEPVAVPPVVHAAAPSAAPAAALAASASPYLSVEEPQEESIDEAKVYVTVPKVGLAGD